MISLMICGVGVGTAVIGMIAYGAGMLRQHQVHLVGAVSAVIHMIGLVIQHSTLLASVDAAVAGFNVYWWWTKGGGDDTKKRLRRWTRKFVPARRTAPSAA